MKISNFISKKIDKKNYFVFIKKTKKFVIVDGLYLTLFKNYYSLSIKDFKSYILKNFPNSNPEKIYSELKELLQIPNFRFRKIIQKYIIPQNLNIFKFKLGDTYFSINYDDIFYAAC